MNEIIKRLETYFERLVPLEGKANTVAGEIIRALNRLVYRWYNDGDMVNRNYGKKTCNAAARYLSEKCPSGIVDRLWTYIREDEYEEILCDSVTKILDWLDSTDLENIHNNDDMLDWYDDQFDRDYDEDEEDNWYEDENYDDEDYEDDDEDYEGF